MNAKPIPFARENVLKENIHIPDKQSFKYMTTEKLISYEEYYHDVLETLCGKQVWTILDSLEHIAYIQHERKS